MRFLGQFATVWPKYSRAKIRYKGGQVDVTVAFGLRFWTLALSMGLFELMHKYNFDPIPGQLALARAVEIDFNEKVSPSWVSSSFEDCIVYDGRKLGNTERTTVPHAAVTVRYRDEWHDNGVCVAFARVS